MQTARSTSASLKNEKMLTRTVRSHVQLDPTFPQLIVKRLLPLPHLCLPLSSHRPLEVDRHRVELDVANLVWDTIWVALRHGTRDGVDMDDTRRRALDHGHRLRPAKRQVLTEICRGVSRSDYDAVFACVRLPAHVLARMVYGALEDVGPWHLWDAGSAQCTGRDDDVDWMKFNVLVISTDDNVPSLRARVVGGSGFDL